MSRCSIFVTRPHRSSLARSYAGGSKWHASLVCSALSQSSVLAVGANLHGEAFWDVTKISRSPTRPHGSANMIRCVMVALHRWPALRNRPDAGGMSVERLLEKLVP